MERDHLKPGTSDAANGARDSPQPSDCENPAAELNSAELVPNAPPDSGSALEPRLEALKQALAQLPPAYRIAIEMRSLARRSFEELAQCLGRSTDEARRLWFQAIEELRKELLKRERTGSGESS